MKREQPDTLTPIEAYRTAIAQKEALSAQFIQHLLRMTENPSTAPSADGSPNREAVQELATRFQALLHTGSPQEQAIRQAYRELLVGRGAVQVDATSPDFKKNLNLFYQEYIHNFPIREEQTSKADFREMLKDGRRTDGYEEVMYMLRCPITGEVMAGWEGSMQPENNSATIWYIFIHPQARRMGLLKAMVDMVRQVAEKAVTDHSHESGRRRYAGSPTIIIECNDIRMLTLDHILLDSTGAKNQSPPRRGDDLTRSAVEQHARDSAWSRAGAYSMGNQEGFCITYYMPDLTQITNIRKKHCSTVARYLNHDRTLDKSSRKLAGHLLKKAIGANSGGYLLDLRVLAQPGQTRVDAQQILDTMKTGYGYSVFIYDKRAKRWGRKGILRLANRDIYIQALAMSIRNNQQNGKLSLIPIRPYGPKGMDLDFQQAAEIVKQVIARIPTWQDKRLKQPFEVVLENMSPLPAALAENRS